MSPSELEKLYNEYPVYLINLRHRKDRLAEAMAEIRGHDWPFQCPQVFRGVDGWKLPRPNGYGSGDGGVLGCRQSHVHILELAIEDSHYGGCDGVIVLEDDITFRPTFRQDMRWFLENVPDDWDMIFPGGQIEGQTMPAAPGVVQAFRVGRTHMYIIRGNAMRETYRHWMSTGGHVDHRLMDIQYKFKVYAPDPNTPGLVGQSRSRSDINGRVNPANFWVNPGTRPIILLRAPVEVVKELRAKHRFHFGYTRDPQTDIDAGLTALMQYPATLPRVNELRNWFGTVQWETAQMDDAVTVVWHPEITADLLRQATSDPVHAIDAASVGEAVEQWQKIRSR